MNARVRSARARTRFALSHDQLVALAGAWQTSRQVIEDGARVHELPTYLPRYRLLHNGVPVAEAQTRSRLERLRNSFFPGAVIETIT